MIHTSIFSLNLEVYYANLPGNEVDHQAAASSPFEQEDYLYAIIFDEISAFNFLQIALCLWALDPLNQLVLVKYID